MKKLIILLCLLILVFCGGLQCLTTENQFRYVIRLKYRNNFKLLSLRDSAFFKVARIRTLSRDGMCEERDVYIKTFVNTMSLNSIHMDEWIGDIYGWSTCVE